MGYWVYSEDAQIIEASRGHYHPNHSPPSYYYYTSEPTWQNGQAELYFYGVFFFLFLIGIVFCASASMDGAEVSSARTLHPTTCWP